MLLKARSAVFSVYLVILTVSMALVLAPTILTPSASRWTIRLWARFVIAGLGGICGLGYDVRGAENIPAGGAIVAAKHQSMWETVALLFLLPKPTIVLKKELLAIPIYGWWAARAGHIGVDRKGGASALRAMRRAAAARVAAGGQVVIFPEGTRTAPGTAPPYKPGVAGLYAAVDAPCTPVAHNSGLYWRHPGIERRPGRIAISFLAAIPEGLDRKPFLAALRAEIDAESERLLGQSPNASRD
ncbi:MAG: lysophospholipid acyltransferase family protein [Pseudomonadota bacterium]